ncbi:spermidine/putrescine ABC transporter permease [Komagataeibacter nataicola]|uniref:Spermidine/putrescine ABC transporter permease n=1 Tax=Komagataeibacter nataicola TaxID=265960 RepID=A0A9N7CC34_9PROT|nr:ABC transporter permease [Komagataeibacter nataicola]AQU88402.1 spermidine/putrescine ABC transporter permease [Komagataeibacter nataicola]PYD65206.1 spermidine/putrescine ABC transporter permease [Komagataeibacter nataicola]WEQ54502.1 ABC transporter permease [Komagataeibacter nataicola]WNM08881.1 ABC transporter permease [Komagataeibacter nataicola]GBR21479.1 spermidine/putrescine ABC transporter permease [Komagataeibacter nataicola NRIC 0616]
MNPLARTLVWRGLITALYVFLLAPIIVVACVSFDTRPYLDFPPRSLSLGSYAGVVRNHVFFEAMLTSMLIGAIAATCSVVLGTMASFGLVRGRFRGRAVFAWFFLSPMLAPHIVLAVGLMMTLQPLGLLNTLSGLVLAHIGITLPYTVRIVSMGLSRIDPAWEEAARVHGASGGKVLWHVTLPVLRPNMLAAGMIAFLISFDEAVIALFIAGRHATTLPLAIYEYIQFRTDPQVAALSVIVIVVSLLPIIVIERSISLRRAVGS